MEVTRVVTQALLMILFCSTNGYGQIPLQLSTQRGSSLATVLGVPRGPLLLNNFSPSAYSANTAAGLSVQDMYSVERKSYSTERRTSTPSFFSSLIASLKNTGYFLLAVVNLTDANRYESLQAAASHLNTAIDCVSIFIENLQNYLARIGRVILRIPVLGLLVRVLSKISDMLNFIPNQILTAIANMIRRTFSTKKPEYNPYAVPKVYSSVF